MRVNHHVPRLMNLFPSEFLPEYLYLTDKFAKIIKFPYLASFPIIYECFTSAARKTPSIRHRCCREKRKKRGQDRASRGSPAEEESPPFPQKTFLMWKHQNNHKITAPRGIQTVCNIGNVVNGLYLQMKVNMHYYVMLVDLGDVWGTLFMSKFRNLHEHALLVSIV